jgi:AsmA family protein
MLPGASSLLRRLLRWLVWAAGGLTAALIATALYIALVGLTIDAAWLRGPVASVFSDSLGRAVRFEGPMELEISAQPKLRVGGLHIANAPGFDGDFASLGEARLNLDLWPLLNKQLQIERLSGSDVNLRLQRSGDGRVNWRFDLPPPRTPAGDDTGHAIDAGSLLARLDIQRVALERVSVEYVGADGKSHWFDLHSLEAKLPADQPVTLALNGTVEKSFPYQVAFSGGRLADLADPAKPWPIDLTLTFLSSTLTLSGAVSDRSGEVRFGLGTETLSEFERLFQTELPRVGATGIAGLISYGPGKVAVRQIAGVMGASTMLGELEFDYGGARPRVSGHLDLPSLDLRPFLSRKPPRTAPEPPPADLAAVYRDLAAASFSLRRLDALDVDLTLRVQRWLSLPGDVRDASVQVRLEAGRLEAPVAATVTGVALSGRAVVDATQMPPQFELALQTRDSELGGLAQLLAGIPGINGRLGRFDLRLAARGEDVGELVRSLDVRLAIERGTFSYGNIEGGRPVDFTLQKFEARLPAGRALSGSLRGSLLGNPLEARLTGGALEAMMLQARTPIEFEARSGNVRASLRGVLQAPAADRGPELKFAVTAPRAGEIANWFGLRPGAEARAALSGTVSLQSSAWRLSNFRFELGRSRLAGALARTGIGTRPLITASLSADTIDVAELESMLPKPEAKAADLGTDGPVLDIPILPKGIDLTDADVTVRVARFEGSPLAVRNLSFDGRIREGYMHPSQFAASVADIALSGAVLLDLRGQEPRAGLWLYANQADVGALLRRLGLVREIDASIEQLALYLDARASRLGDMLARSLLTATVSGGRLTLRDRNLGGEARIAVHTGELRALPGQPVGLALNGSLDDIPLDITLDTAPAADLVNPALKLPFRLKLAAARSEIGLSGHIARPIGQNIELALEARGERFDTLNRLLRAQLPPWGPWSAAGRFRMSPRGYAVNDLRLQVGDSVLTGEGGLRTDAARPRIDVSLAAPNIQLDDFRLGDWSPVEKKPREDPKALTPEELRRQAAQASDKAQTLLSPEVLGRQDAFVKVRVDQVLSGKDRLGSGSLEAKLENGRADIGPVQVSIPGGSAKLWFGYQPTERDVRVDLRIAVDRFDYGILARRIKPDTDLRGSFSLNVDVASSARYLSEVLKHGSGKIEFAVWPVNMKAGIFDLWAVNLLVALVPAVDPSGESRVNCAVGRFVLDHGKLVDRTIVLDTNRMRVTGQGSADFNAESMRLRMKPRAKTAQFFSLAIPIEVSGPFDSFRIRVAPGDVAETVTRLATSIVWVPLQKLFGKKIPKDGSDVCSAPLELPG